MVKCPFCGFENEDGALFCEQCKSDLSAVPSTPTLEPEPAHAAEVPMAAIMDEPISHRAKPFSFAASESVSGRSETFPILNLDEPMPSAESYPSAELLPVAEALPVEESLPAAELLPEAMPAPEAEAPTALPVAEAVAAELFPEPPATIPLPAAPASTGPATVLPPGAQPRLKVMRGVKVGVEFPIYPDFNYIGRADEKPVDVDLEDQEPPDRVWCSRQHAVIHFDEARGSLTLEDLNSSNGTFVNRTRVYPGEKRELNPNDVVQIGTVHMKLLV